MMHTQVIEVSGHKRRVNLLWQEECVRRVRPDCDEAPEACEQDPRVDGFIPIDEVSVELASVEVVEEIDVLGEEAIDSRNLDPLDVLIMCEERRLAGIDDGDADDEPEHFEDESDSRWFEEYNRIAEMRSRNAEDDAIRIAFGSAERQPIKPRLTKERAEKKKGVHNSKTLARLGKIKSYHGKHVGGGEFGFYPCEAWLKKTKGRYSSDSHGIRGRKPTHEKHYRATIRRDARVVDKYYIDSGDGWNMYYFTGSFVELRAAH